MCFVCAHARSMTGHSYGCCVALTCSRSTLYSTDIGKTFGVPIFHVNADDPEAVWRVFRLAGEYRQKWHTDVIIDLIGYRRHGHNEMDEPMFTQPKMYQKIKEHPSAATLYKRKLVEEGTLTSDEVEEMQVCCGPCCVVPLV